MFCSWSSIARFKRFQDKVKLGIASLDIKEAVPIITLLWKYLHHQIQLQLNRYLLELLTLSVGIISSKFVNKKCSTHATEHVHVFTFHFFCLSYENLRFENGRKLRSGFGIVKILSHFWELGDVLYIFGIVVSCLTFFVLEVCSKNQRIRILMLKQEARVFFKHCLLEVEDRSSGLGLEYFSYLHHIIAHTTPRPILLIFMIFWLFFFLFWLIYFS